jgi:hypothetical protein
MIFNIGTWGKRIVKLHFKHINIKEIKNGSAAFTGENRPLGFQDNKILSDGFGSLNGERNIHRNSKHIYAKEEKSFKKENTEQ